MEISVYIDTNCINARNSIPGMNKLEQLYEEDKILIEKTDTLDTELHKKGLEKPSNYIENYGVGVVGHSRVGSCVVGSQKDELQFQDILNKLWGKKEKSKYTRQQIRDAMHISTAKRYGADFFVTQDKTLIEKSKELNLLICTPEQCLEILNKKYGIV